MSVTAASSCPVVVFISKISLIIEIDFGGTVGTSSPFPCVVGGFLGILRSVSFFELSEK